MWVFAISIFRSPCSARFSSALKTRIVKMGFSIAHLVLENMYDGNYELKQGYMCPLLLVFQRKQKLSHLISKLQ